MSEPGELSDFQDFQALPAEEVKGNGIEVIWSIHTSYVAEQGKLPDTVSHMKKFAISGDLLLILLFVLIGRSSHGHELTFAGVFVTFWPFAAGVLAGWLLIWRTHRNPLTRTSGLIIALLTVLFGMLLRVVSGQGTEFTFILVATLFLSLFLIVWRFALSIMRQNK